MLFLLFLQSGQDAINNIAKRLADLPFLRFDGRTEEQETAERKSLQTFLEAELVRLKAEKKVKNKTKLQMEMETMSLNIVLEQCNVQVRFCGKPDSTDPFGGNTG